MATFSGFTDAAYALSASSPTAYFSLGGLMTRSTDPGLAGLSSTFPLEGLVEFNFNEVRWSNSSSTPYGGTIFGGNTGFAALGQGLYVPIFGLQGILVFIGGDAPTTQKAYTEGDSLVPMDQITIYDIHSQTFYLQNAGGTVPYPRINFCAVGAASAENYTWEIFIYGGNHPDTGTAAYSLGNDTTVLGLDKVYILTLPAFRWIEAPGTSGTTRSYHHCQVIGQRQMLSIGGQAINGNISVQDPWTNGLRIFDMSELTWSFNYDANAAAYTPPTLVSNYYNTSNRYPSFNDAALAAIFNITATSTTAPSTSVTTPPLPASKSSHTGAIAGCVVGGVVAIALLAGLCYLFWQRHKQQKYNAANFETHPDFLEMDTGIVPEMDKQRRPSEMYNNVHATHTLARDGDTAVRAELG